MIRLFMRVLMSVILVSGVLMISIASAEGKKQDDGLYYGFGIGLGSAGITLKGANLTFNEELTKMGAASVDALISVNFKVGRKLSRKLWIGFDGTIATQRGSYGYLRGIPSMNTQLFNMLALLTYYPYEKGFFMRGGAGLANYSQSISVIGISIGMQNSGLAILAGLGYAFKVQDNFNITANVDYSRQSYAAGPEGLTASQAMLLYAGFDWY